MKKIRCYLAAIALAATLSGPALLGIGVVSIANTASSGYTHSVSSAFVAGKSTRSVAVKPLGPCPVLGHDC